MPITQDFLKDYVIDGGVTMYALIPLSIYTFGLIFQRSLELRKSKVAPQSIIELSKSVNNRASYLTFKNALEIDTSPLANIIQDYIRLGEAGESMNPKDDLTPIDDEAEQLYHGLSAISTSYVVAPLIGVLGTTIGIMETFKQFAISGKRDMSALVTAIDQSLITTMWGLAIAVPAYFFYALLQNRVFTFERKILPQIACEITHRISPFIASEK